MVGRLNQINMKIFPVILSGGSGTRLWPLSRKNYPKQYLPLIDEYSMLQNTIQRLVGIEFLESPIVVCGSEHRFIVAEQLKYIGIEDSSIILEPIGRNTAPAIASAAFYIQQNKSDEDHMLLVLAADHLIEDNVAFHATINNAIEHAIADKLVTFGVLPVSPNTGYGYIKACSTNEDKLVMNVECFKEKPDLNTAKKYLAENTSMIAQNSSPSWYWNGGMFLFKAKTLLNELSKHNEDVLVAAKKSVARAKLDLDFLRLDEREFSASPDISIDFALMEKSNKVVVAPLDAGWSDLGTWPALFDASIKDENNNVLEGDVVAYQTTNCYVSSPSKLVATMGVDNLIIVNSSDALLITSSEQAHNVKNVINILNASGRKEAVSNQKVHRPWGWFDSIELGDNYQVKRLHVNPGEKLSLQMHHKRAEHWVVVKGTATATVGEEVLSVGTGESIYIPITVKHALENRTEESLDIIEVQTGTYLGEDDIVRFSDIYGRTE